MHPSTTDEEFRRRVALAEERLADLKAALREEVAASARLLLMTSGMARMWTMVAEETERRSAQLRERLLSAANDAQ